MAKIGLNVKVILCVERISLTLFRIVTSVMPETEDTSLWRTFCPNKTDDTYRYAEAIPFGALPSVMFLVSVFEAISIASRSTLASVLVRFAIIEMYLSIVTTGVATLPISKTRFL